jgi:putative pyrroloquinoline-quinone binding quinoprotein
MSGVSRWWMIGVVPVILGVALLVTGCPQHRTNTPSKSAQGAKVLWSIQLEGDPWPWAVVDGNLLVWTYRFAHAGFLFPIKLESYNAQNGRTNWSVPVRPWLWSTDAPWSFNAVLFKNVLGAWVKGNVARSLRLDTGQEAWSIPLCHGLARAGKWLVVASESRLMLLDPSTGKTQREIFLTSPLAAPPLVRGQILVGLQEDAHLVGVNLTTGKRIWRHKVGGAAGQPDRPLAAGNLVLLPHLPTGSAGGSTTAALLEARRISTGKLVWRRSVPAPASSTKGSPLSGLRVAGDLLMLLQNDKSCLQVLNLADGSPRFRRCGLHLSSAPVRHGKWLYVLGTDKRSAAALSRGEPWSTVDFPLLAVHTRTGRARAVMRPGSRRRRRSLRLRAVRLQSSSQASGTLYLLQRQRFLTAFRLEPK